MRQTRSTCAISVSRMSVQSRGLNDKVIGILCFVVFSQLPVGYVRKQKRRSFINSHFILTLIS